MLTAAEIDALVGNPPVGGKPLPAVVSAAELCALTGTSQNASRELITRDVWVKVGRDRFDVRESIRNHVAELTQRAKRGAAGSELDREKVRVQKATAEKLELANAESRGDLIPAADVERAWAGVLRDLRAGLLAVPSRVGSRIPTLTPHDVGAINREISDVLNELSGDATHADD